jgi:hypothetical protein
MRIKLLLVSILALVLASCGGGATNVKKKDAAVSTGRVFKTLQSALLAGATKPNLSPQAVVVDPVQLTVNCDTGSITYTLSSTETSFTYSLSTSQNGCVEAGVKINATNFTMTFSVSEAAGQTTYSITYNGSISVTVGNVTDSVSFNNFSFTVRITGNSATLVMNGTVTANGETVTFNNESFTYAELGI